MNGSVPSPWARRPVRIFIGFIALLWCVQIAAHVLGFRILSPNLESASDRAAYGQTYTHK